MRELFNDFRSYWNTKTNGTAFDYRFLRGVIGIVAILLPIVTYYKSGIGPILSSISHSYYTPAIDVFVGILFFVCAFLSSYKGHTKGENIASTLAAFFALGVALFPTDEVNEPTSTIGTIHFISAIGMFSILAYFCLFPFAKGVKEKIDKAGAGVPTAPFKRRRWIYIICGWTIILVMVGYAVVTNLYNDFAVENQLLFWVEAIALVTFGIAWSVAAKYLPYLK